MRRKTWKWFGAFAASVFVFAALLTGGCANERAEQGDPPQGYETWDDYWAAQDKLNRKLDTDRQRRLQNERYDARSGVR